MQIAEVKGVLGHDFALNGYTGPQITWEQITECITHNHIPNELEHKVSLIDLIRISFTYIINRSFSSIFTILRSAGHRTKPVILVCISVRKEETTIAYYSYSNYIFDNFVCKLRSYT